MPSLEYAIFFSCQISNSLTSPCLRFELDFGYKLSPRLFLELVLKKKKRKALGTCIGRKSKQGESRFKDRVLINDFNLCSQAFYPF